MPVFDFGVVGGEYFMTQEYILGRDLGRVMERQRAAGGPGCPSPVAYFAAHETLQALAYAHARRAADGTPLGIVHRDIAAGNILVSLAGEVKLSDFGIVKSNDRVSRTQVGVVKGNTNFMSPEQARGQAVDARSDLFSLGLVLYYCLSGEMLYGGNNDLEVLHHAAGGLLREDFARIRRLPDPAPQILERALALDPNHRFQTAAEFADELAVHMGGGRIGAAPADARAVRPRSSDRTETALPAATGGRVHCRAVIDTRLLREKPDEVRTAYQRLGATVDLDGVIAADTRVRDLKNESQTLQAEQNRLSKEIGRAAAGEARERAKADSTALKEKIEKLNGELAAAEAAPGNACCSSCRTCRTRRCRSARTRARTSCCARKARSAATTSRPSRTGISAPRWTSSTSSAA